MISLLNILLWKAGVFSKESLSEKMIKGVLELENTTPSKALLKSLINSNFLGRNIFKHSRNPFITITLLLAAYFNSSVGKIYWIGFLEFEKLEPFKPWVPVDPWAFVLTLMKCIKFSKSLG